MKNCTAEMIDDDIIVASFVKVSQPAWNFKWRKPKNSHIKDGELRKLPDPFTGNKIS
jgi:hypothetical protein